MSGDLVVGRGSRDMSERLDINGRSMEWAQLLDEALTLEAGSLDVYSRFHDYSYLNQLLLRLQGVSEPVAGYKRWNALDRYVKKGSKAKFIYVPITRTLTDDDGEKHQRVTGFKLVPRVFAYSDTDGEPLPEVEPRDWDKTRALGALAIKEAPWNEINGNCQGMSWPGHISISPVAKYPFKTLHHELAHHTLGHVTPEGNADYIAHRGIMEAEAESTAYLVMNELGTTDHFNAADSRAYITNWLRGGEFPDTSIRRVFSATTKILQAGRVAIDTEIES
jgi:hypothetical protein